MGGLYTAVASDQEEGRILQQGLAIEMGGVPRYFSQVLRSGVHVTLLGNKRANFTHPQRNTPSENTLLGVGAYIKEKGRYENPAAGALHTPLPSKCLLTKRG